MATKDNLPGLFSRVANFVRSPSATGESPDRQTELAQAENSAQAIKRLLARKSHNDAVRKREFAQLRKLRQASSQDAIKMVERESFFLESSGFSVLEERASTLKKIDEIEAQMSKQWWKNRQEGVAQSDSQPAPVTTTVLAQGEAESESETRNSFAATLPAELDASGAMAQPSAHARSRFEAATASRAASTPSRTKARQFELTGNSAFSVSKMVTIEMGETLSDPVLEDAAIRFANGDDAGAEAVLLEAMRAKDAPAESLDTWASALFDLYRSTGEQEKFDRFALDYAMRFDRSAPVWFSTRVLLGSGIDATVAVRTPTQSSGSWVCPGVLDVTAVSQLRATLCAGRTPAKMDWRAMESIAPDALVPLAAVLALCCEQTLALRIQGEGVLTELLRQHTPVGNNRTEPVWWKLRLDWLRILGLQSEFELVAMDYCITYEVSPPSWVPAKSQLYAAQDTAHVPASSPPDTQPDTVRQGTDATVALTGELIGDVGESLQRLEQGQHASDDLLVGCELLIRVDFAAAGSILNWVTHCHSQGRQVEFVQAPRLVGAFFNLVGINEYAKITVRAN